MPRPDPDPDLSDGPAEAANGPDEAAADQPAEPLNRAERRAQRRGRKPALPPPTGKGPQAGQRGQVVPRRSGRRGNR